MKPSLRARSLAAPATYIATCTVLTLISTFAVTRSSDQPALTSRLSLSKLSWSVPGVLER